jgi:hypothetical protein
MLLAALCARSVCAAPELRIPKPTDPLKPAPPPPALEPSIVNLEVRFPAETLAAAIDEGFPQVAAREDDWSNAAVLGDRQDVRILYRLVRGSFRYRMERDHFDVWFDHVRYRLWARRSEGDQFIDGRCGHGDDPPKRLQLAGHSALMWSDRWRLQSQTTFEAPVFLEPCALTGLDVDATPFLKTMIEARLTALAQRIDGIIRERTEAKNRAETVWRALQEPVEFAPNQWLEFNPRDARVSPITSKGTLVVHTSVNLMMEPKIANGSKAEKAEIPLPRLQLAPLAQEGFHLALPFTVDYGRINQRLEQEMIGQEWRTPLGDRVNVQGVQLYGSGERLILAVRLSGGVNGTVFATGTPVYDEGLEVVKFVDLDFTVDTRNALVRSANWMFHENILSTLRSEAFIDLSEQLRTMRSRLQTALTRELGADTRMEAEITRLRPRGIYPTVGGVEVQMIAEGSIWVELK